MELTTRFGKDRQRAPWFLTGTIKRAALALMAALAVASVIALVVLDTRAVSGGPIALPGTFAPFTADVLSTTEGRVERSKLTWQDYQNWRFDTFDPSDPAKVSVSQRAEAGSLTIINVDFEGQTNFPEVTDRVPGEWFVTSGTALGRGGIRMPGDKPVIRRTSSRPCDQFTIQLCGNRTSLEEISEYEFNPGTGVPVRYTVSLDGKVFKDVRLTNIRPQ